VHLEVQVREQAVDPVPFFAARGVNLMTGRATGRRAA
jgi:hypothetical protein